MTFAWQTFRVVILRQTYATFINPNLLYLFAYDRRKSKNGEKEYGS